MKFILILLPSFLLCTGCSYIFIAPQQPIKLGEHILIEYTCRTYDGKLAATTDKTVAEDTDLPHSPHFHPLAIYLPASQTVPASNQTPAVTSTMSFEEMLELSIAQAAVDAQINIPLTLTISGAMIPNISGGDRYLTLNRHTRQKRNDTVPTSEFKKIFGSDPETGMTIGTRTPGIKVTVKSIENDLVNLEYTATPGAVIPSPFGPGIITQTAETLEIDTDAKPGTIIRSGGIIGQITEVNDSTYVVDYGHSSGFTPLTCEAIFKPFASPDGLTWLHDLDQAKNESIQSGKFLLIHFHDQWSPSNREFISKVLPTPKVTSVTENFVRVRINATDHIPQLKENGVSTIPTVIIYDNEGNEVQRLVGLPTVDEFTDELKQLLKK
jgi:FKBP-type peptidyl-prolyl cis-trans isomerase 2